MSWRRKRRRYGSRALIEQLIGDRTNSETPGNLGVARGLAKQVLPAPNGAGSQHYFHDLGEDEPVEPEADGARQRMRENVEPRNPACDYTQFSQQ